MDGLDFVKCKVRKLREIFEPILNDFGVDFERSICFHYISHGKARFDFVRFKGSI